MRHKGVMTVYTKHQWNCAPWKSFNYVVNLPKDYDESKTYPLVFFLHGAGERGDDLEVASRHGYMRYVRHNVCLLSGSALPTSGCCGLC